MIYLQAIGDSIYAAGQNKPQGRKKDGDRAAAIPGQRRSDLVGQVNHANQRIDILTHCM
jgi:hypothetical protein